MLPVNDTDMSIELTKSEAIEAMENGAKAHLDEHSDYIFFIENGVLKCSKPHNKEGDIVGAEWFNSLPELGWSVYEEPVKHTPLPWKITYSSTGHPYIYTDGRPVDGTECIAHPFSTMGKEEAEGNARLIVKAVNNHEALVNVLNDARILIKSLECDHLLVGYQDLLPRIEKALKNVQ